MNRHPQGEHNSTAHTLPESKDTSHLELSSRASEWLFAHGFWKKVNDALSTLFDQYEEEEADAEILTGIQGLLREEIAHLEQCSNPEMEFVRGWDADGKELKMCISKSNLLSELKRLHSFIANALIAEKGISFDL